MKILVTGSQGQLGNEIKKIKDSYPQHEFIFTDIEELDICQGALVKTFIGENNINLVINCAAYTAVDKAETDIESAYALNADAVMNLCEAVKTCNAFLVHISTDYVFDGTSTKPYNENDKPNPLSVYGKSKLKGEEAIIHSQTPSYIVRTSWLYSSFGNNFVKTILRLSKERNELKIVNDQHGTPTYAADLADVLLKMITFYPLPKQPEIYHYSNEGETTWFGFAKSILEIIGRNVQIYPITTQEYPTPAKRPMYSVFDKNKIKKQFNIYIPHWHDSLKNCLHLLQSLNP